MKRIQELTRKYFQIYVSFRCFNIGVQGLIDCQLFLEKEEAWERK